MNSDKFDRVVLDLLYGELDELTTLAAHRHMQQSPRAKEILSRLEVTRQLSTLPRHEPPPHFAEEILARETRAVASLPLHHRLGRVISMLAGYAMRPQLVMGALLLLMIGASLMLLRARPGQHGAMQVTGRGAPEADLERILPVPSKRVDAHDGTVGAIRAGRNPFSMTPPRSRAQRPDPSPVNAGTGSATPAPAAQLAAPGPSKSGVEEDEGLDPFDQAVQVYRAGHYVEAQRRFERISRRGGSRAAEAALYSAQSTRNASGCGPAVSRFEKVRLRFPGSGSAYEAAWRAAKCLQRLGDTEAARQNYETLLLVGSHSERARGALRRMQGTVPAPIVSAAQALRAKPAKKQPPPAVPAPIDDMPEQYAARPSSDSPATPASPRNQRPARIKAPTPEPVP